MFFKFYDYRTFKVKKKELRYQVRFHQNELIFSLQTNMACINATNRFKIDSNITVSSR